ncbi:MAG TPA: hypothetical protein VFL53_03495 [Pseudolabrys sp.]|nr:hypothetical protein [Pseudolabrys sp.]
MLPGIAGFLALDLDFDVNLEAGTLSIVQSAEQTKDGVRYKEAKTR